MNDPGRRWISMLSKRNLKLRVMALTAVGIVLSSVVLVPSVHAAYSNAELRAALLTNRNLPDYNRYEVTKPEARTYWCNTYVRNPYTAGIQAQFAGKGRFEDERWLYEDLYSYNSARVAARWFAKQRTVGRSCRGFVTSSYRYFRIQKAKPPNLRGVSQISALRYQLRVAQSGWTNYFLLVTARRGDWTQIVTIAERAGWPPRARSGKLVREAFHKAVARLG
jgi:hypothetical protein